MASVQITGTILSDAADLTSSLTLYTTKFVEKGAVSGRVQTYASGRQRAISSVGTSREVSCQFTLVNPADVTKLVGWVGRTLLLRDAFGFKEFVTFFDFQRDQQVFPAVSDIPITFRVITYSEAV